MSVHKVHSTAQSRIIKQAVRLVFILGLGLPVNAQEFDIRSFTTDPSDLRARISDCTTVNGEVCALIDVVTNIKGMQFDSRVGIVDVKHRSDGYEVYVAPLERSIKLMAPGYLTKEVSLPSPAVEKSVYKLVVATIENNTPARSDLLRITFRINENNVYIRHGSNAPVMSSGKNAVYDLPRGRQTFTFSKPGFEDEILEIDLHREELIEVTLQPGAPTPVMALSGFIIVSSNPEGAEVFLNDQRVGETTYQGRQPPGTFRLRLRKHLYHEYEEQFTLAEGGTVTLPTVQLKPRFGHLRVHTKPDDSEVYLDGKLVGKSPIEGLQAESGFHSLSIRRSGYHERQESFSLADGENKSLSYVLLPAYGRLAITSDPPGAEVFLDERPIGTTPFEETRMPSGRYNLRLTLPLYSTEQREVQVKDEESTERFFALTKNYGALRIESNGADIFLDEKKIGVGTVDHRVSPGSYTLTAKKNRHDDDTREVFLTVGQTEVIALNPVPHMGAVSIMTKPFEASGAEIWIDGEKTAQRTPAVVELLEGDYTVVLKKDEFNDESFTLSIERGIEISREIEMNDSPPKGKLVLTDAGGAKGAKIFINGKKISNTVPATIELEEGNHEIRFSKQEYNDLTRTVRIVGDKSSELKTVMLRADGYPSGAVNCSGFATSVVEVRNPVTGRIWMDRNLGARRAATGRGDASAYGDFYQWGRFSDGHQCRNSSTTNTLSNSDAPAHGQFILSSKISADWRSSPHNNLWQGADGVNNPCPAGFRLPTGAEWNTELRSWSSNATASALASPLRLIPAGARFEGGGGINFEATIGVYWSSTALEIKSYALEFVDASVGVRLLNRASGYSVRCIKD